MCDSCKESILDIMGEGKKSGCLRDTSVHFHNNGGQKTGRKGSAYLKRKRPVGKGRL